MRLWCKISLGVLCFAFALLGATDAKAQSFGDELGLSPFWEWKTLETEHFRLSFPEEISTVAVKAANALEEAHRLLAPRLRWEPATRTQVLLLDNTDLANGMATPVGRFGMVFFVTPPDNWSSISNYDDWLRMLAIHEYTHFLNMDPTRGLWEPLRVLFGDVFLPNSLWPVWMLEGLAVYMETALTRGGRGRSTFYEMVLRAAVEEDALDSPDFITLDKVNGPNPYYPGGETAYLFGYEMMNEIAQSSPGREANLGEMSFRSSHRIPFFINGNLKNITGKDFYQFWGEWVEKTRARIQKDLDRLRASPLTPLTRLTQKGYEALGPRVSPNGSLLAYTQDSLDRRNGLYVRDLKTGEVNRLCDKLEGVGIAFTPDSRKILFSAVKRKAKYSLLSDLFVYDLDQKKEIRLTTGLRAKDPDVSADGRFVVFTVTEQGTVHLALAPLEQKEGEVGLSPHRILYQAAPYDAVAGPRFSSDGSQVVFSIHRSGEVQEDLLVIPTAGGEAKTLVRNGARNRFPAFDAAGALYFTSDVTGVDNLFRLSSLQKSEPTQISNVTTGLWFPAPAPSQEVLYASVFSTGGWDLAQIASKDFSAVSAPLSKKEVSVPLVSTSPSPAPAQSIQDYSAWPTLWPRQWAPILLWDETGVYFGGEVAGFDALDRHQYLLQAAYDTEVKEADGVLYYANRSLGPRFSFLARKFTSEKLGEPTAISFFDLFSSNKRTTLVSYTRKTVYQFGASYPFLWTYSSLTPAFSFNIEREAAFYSKALGNDLISKSRYVPSGDFTFSFSNSEGSRLSVSAERGRNAVFGTRYYQDSFASSWKTMVADIEHVPVTSHSVLVPFLRAATTSRINPFYADANVAVSGRTRSNSFDLPYNGLPGTSLDEFMVRGYPETTQYTRMVAIGSLDYRFPLWRVFRGMGTNPLFVEDFYGFVFGESAYFPTRHYALPSAGGGIRLATKVFLHVPLVLSLEYHKGFKESLGGTDDLFVALHLSRFEF